MAAPLVVGLSVLGLLLAGCGGGASAGATVSVYVSAPLCAAAKRELSSSDGRAGDLRVRIACLSPVEAKGRVDLAATGANARRATEDSAAVAFLETPGPAARFSRPIVETAGIAWVESESGGAEMKRVIDAIGEAGNGSVRDSVRESLG